MTMTTHLVRALLLAGFAMLIVYLFQTGDITLYIAPKMEILVKLSAIGLYAAAIYQIYAALQARLNKRKAAECDCGHHRKPSRFKSFLVYGLFLLPLVLGFLVPTGTLGSALAAKKGVSFSGNEAVSRTGTEQQLTGQAQAGPGASPAAAVADPLDALFPFDEYTVDHAALAKVLYAQDIVDVPEKQFIETLTALDLYRDAFIGKKVRISGFIYREDDMGDDRFAVSRFAMNCCSADALPYGLMTTWPKASEYAEDEWVTVVGTLALSDYMDNEILTLELTRIERIEAPETPYVYPDFDFGF
jgi:uncharacterized repeat protein (TIGR03943 family)